jgi:hypothetical protein
MPSIKKPSLALALALLALLGLLSVAGCGDKNSYSTYDPDIGQHPAGWLPAGHAPAALRAIDTCTQCHGQDLNGGISKVSCNLCHLGGPGHVHPVEWDIHGHFGYALHGGYVQQHGAQACANIYCHGANLEGVAGSGPSCSSCHMGGPFEIHPQVWRNDITLHGGWVLQNGTAGCRNATCHGPQLQGVFLSGPGCNDCHAFDEPIANIPGPITPTSAKQLWDKYKARQALKKQ